MSLNRTIEDLEAVLCDPEGNVSIAGSEGDRVIIAKALKELKSLHNELEGGVKNIGADLLEIYFPKGKCQERGQALVLYALMVIRFTDKIHRATTGKGILTCPKCGGKLKHLKDPITKKISRHLLGCKCLGDKVVSVG